MESGIVTLVVVFQQKQKMLKSWLRRVFDIAFGKKKNTEIVIMATQIGVRFSWIFNKKKIKKNGN